ncbi:MAG: sulfatase-like hydrolase/transferase [Planctomycetaceae bacterium]|jgi:arylsulfatase A-like enzyme|nr:sulfatase-like hydrolase/transferase [Planctomycetaceae bacterium]
MKKLMLVVIVLAVSYHTSLTVHAEEKSAKKETRPNILLVHADDVGWGDFTSYNSASKIHSPEIDRLAETGIRFTDVHTPAALCAPTRYALLTGNYPWRGRFPGGDWNWHTDTQFLPGQKTFGHFLQQAGYRTAIFGKANLGLVYERMNSPDEPDFSSKLAEGPIQWGFDYSYIIPRGHQSFPYAFYENNVLVGDSAKITTLKAGKVNGGQVNADGPGVPDWDSSQTGRILTEKVIAFIDNHLEQNKKDGTDKPFLIHFNTDGAHGPYTPPEELFGRKVAGETKMTAHTDMVLEVDVIVGHLVKELRKRHLYSNTVIIITSDNGGIPAEREKFGHDAVGGLRGNKSTIWEGGTRVPFIVHWGDDTAQGSKIKPGTVTHQVVGTHDLAATFADIAGTEPGEDQALDSVSFLPVLLGKQSEDKPIRESLLVQSSPGSDIQFPLSGRVPEQFRNRPNPQNAYRTFRSNQAKKEGGDSIDGIAHAILKDRRKLFLSLTDQPEFFVNLKDDPKEEVNLLEDASQKKRIEEYQTIYKTIRESKRSTPPLKISK